ncbi:ribonucleoside-diphosphate reductase class Ib glutaredoxin subunit [Rhodobacter sp. 140A]|nr:ribonucleoside-diphosphate reductase class Ib glutaredoxin subunit [Rhodobacter sp. 140A]
MGPEALCNAARPHLPASLILPPHGTDKGPEMSITVYSKPACVQCTATTRALAARGLAFDLVDLTEDAEALARVTELGYRQAPVVMTADDHWAGFRPDKIAALV